MTDFQQAKVCPPWCTRQYPPEHLTHIGEGEAIRTSAARFPSVTVGLVRMLRDPVQVMVMRHDPNNSDSVYLEPDDATKWAAILDAAGAADLAGAIRQAVAVLAQDGGES